MARLLLISNSTVHGKGYLEHCDAEVKEFLKSVKTLLFIPYAIKDHDGYAKVVTDRFEKMGITVTSIHTVKDPKEAVQKAEALFIGGGNTFRLLNLLYKNDLIAIIQGRVAEGMPYMGSSAGSNMACPTIKTTNDMPIIQPPSFDALDLIPFQINPHYLDADPNSKHMGETREKRIIEFLEENTTPVLGLREGAWLRIEDDNMMLKGTTGARLFQREKDPIEYTENTDLSSLLKEV